MNTYFCHQCQSQFQLPPTATSADPFCSACASDFVEAVDEVDSDSEFAAFDTDGSPTRVPQAPIAGGLADLFNMMLTSQLAPRRRGTAGIVGGTTGIGSDPHVRAGTFAGGVSFSSQSGGRPVFYGDLAGLGGGDRTVPPMGATSTIRDRVQERDERGGQGGMPGMPIHDNTRPGTAADANADGNQSTDPDISLEERRREDVTRMIHLLFSGMGPVRSGGSGSGSNSLFQLFGGIGDPRDYAFGQSGYDDVITQLMEQLEHGNTPRLTEDQIARLPRVFVRAKDLGEHPECPVCQEDFSNEGNGEQAVKLECLHHFHPSCIENWLKLNASCPVCRKPVTDPARGPASI
ncbi:hypothetical protein HDU81_000659 [Chytriomyces hyalinus]|nr:hypothetical protein HDU81_000659 [Chytriomyces hyalinus]